VVGNATPHFEHRRYIGSDFNYPHKAEFDAEYMKRLFEYAHQLGANGHPWHKAPPGEAAPEHH
jgi:hypothetical protein